jgi:hypothetical protein
MRYITCERQVQEKRAALKAAGVTQHQLHSHAIGARDLARFLKRLQRNPRITIANDPPEIGPGGSMPLSVLCEDLRKLADWLEKVIPFCPDSAEAIVALVLHAEKETGQRRLVAISDLLNYALEAASLPGQVTAESLKKRVARADASIHAKAKKLLATR